MTTIGRNYNNVNEDLSAQLSVTESDLHTNIYVNVENGNVLPMHAE